MSDNFRENLRNELDYQGIIVKELSVRTGIPVATLDCYLGARATMPSVEAAVKIAKALQVSVEYLVTGVNSNLVKNKKRHSREAQKLAGLVDNLSQEQCRAILNLLNLCPFREQTLSK